mgnify:CR=1 FL=1
MSEDFMDGLIEVVDAGIANSIQDLGRLGFRHMGIAVSGCLDPMLARCANALAGNPAQAACIEVRAAGPKLAVRRGPVRFALSGDLSATLVIRLKFPPGKASRWKRGTSCMWVFCPAAWPMSPYPAALPHPCSWAAVRPISAPKSVCR